MDDRPTSLRKMQKSAQVDAEAIAAGLRPAELKAMKTRDGQGEYSSATLDKLLAKGLVEGTLRFTDLGRAVRDVLMKEKG